MTPKEKSEVLDRIMEAARVLKQAVLIGNSDVPYLENQLLDELEGLWL